MNRTLFICLMLCALAFSSSATVSHTIRSGIDLNWYFHTDPVSDYSDLWRSVGYWKDFNGDSLSDFVVGLENPLNGDVRIMVINASATGSAKTYPADKVAGRDISSQANVFVPDSLLLVSMPNHDVDGDLWIVGTNSPDATDSDDSYTKFIFWKLNKNDTTLPTQTNFEINADSTYNPRYAFLEKSYNSDTYPDILVHNTLLNANGKFWVALYSGSDGSVIWSKEYAKDTEDPGTGAFGGLFGTPTLNVSILPFTTPGNISGDFDNNGKPEFLLWYFFGKDLTSPNYVIYTDITLINSDGNFISPFSGWERLAQSQNGYSGYAPNPSGDYTKDNYVDAVFYNMMVVNATEPIFIGYDLKNKTSIFESVNSEIGTGSELWNLFPMPSVNGSLQHMDITGDTWNDIALYNFISFLGNSKIGIFNGYAGNGANKGKKAWFASLPDYNSSFYPVSDFNKDGIADFGVVKDPATPGSMQSGKLSWKLGHAHVGASNYAMGREFYYHVPYSFTYNPVDDSFTAAAYEYFGLGDIDGDSSNDYLFGALYIYDQNDDGTDDETAFELYVYDDTVAPGTPPTTAEMEVWTDEDIINTVFFTYAVRSDTLQSVDNNGDGAVNDGIIANTERYVYSISFQGIPAIPTPTPTPTLTPTPIETYDFEGDSEGWTFKGEVPPFDVPGTLAQNGVIALTPSDSANAFSYWESPQIGIDAINTYRIRWTIGCTLSDADKTPAFRLRANNVTNWLAYDTIINSNANAAPVFESNKIYDLFVTPVGSPKAMSMSPDNLTLNFDIMSFDWNDDLNSYIFVDEVKIDRVFVTGTGTMAGSWTFDSSAEGWTFAGTISGYDTPSTNSGSGYVTLSANGSTNCFSYWQSNNISVSENTLYRVRWTVASTVTDPTTCLDFRLRVNEISNWRAWDRIVPSNGTNSPTLSTFKEFDLVITPQMETASDTLQLSFDIMSFDPSNALNSWLLLDEAKVEEITIWPE